MTVSAEDRPLAVIVAHGSPSDPETLDCAVQKLADDVDDRTDGITVRGATLAKPGALEHAVRDCAKHKTVAVYPFFMSLGWFVRKELRRRVSLATDRDVRFLTPFGLDARIPGICARRASDGLNAIGARPEEGTLLLAAHGSRRGHAAARAARSVARRIEWLGTFREVRVGFVEEQPTIEEPLATS